MGSIPGQGTKILLTLKWSEHRSVVSNSLWPHGPYSPWNSPGQNTGVGTSSLLQGIFPIQESNLDLLNFRQILYQLSHKGSPRTLEWVAYPSPADLPNPGIEPGSPVLQLDSLPTDLHPRCNWIFGREMLHHGIVFNTKGVKKKKHKTCFFLAFFQPEFLVTHTSV